MAQGIAKKPLRMPPKFGSWELFNAVPNLANSQSKKINNA